MLRIWANINQVQNMLRIKLIFGLFIIRSGVLLSLVSLGRGFGKLRFLKGWLSSYRL